ncbi:gastrulation defective protein 1 homolog isoform X2 [Nilaparvata lugens]|uniref:gastrulation defective protein 1 homolog isoform X2 n=1 Tax=Nilaparvata lugens TaxID=108931 RepID=UPI00193E6EE0|nr:gastrulation defective protein 1 homolog isoform X2 [Nilaparvata lugens]
MADSDNSDSSDDFIGPPVPKQYSADISSKNQTGSSKTKEKDSSDEDSDIIGPPIPQQYKSTTDKSSKIGGNESSEEDDELIGPPIPQQFKSTKDDFIGPPVPKRISEEKSKPSIDKLKISSSNQESSDEEEEDDNDDDEEDDIKLKIPLQCEISIAHGNKAINALAVDPAGARLATGSIDYEVKFWDFAGMDNTLQSFRSMNPCGNHPIKGLQYSTTGDTILLVSGMSQAKVLDRDGHELMECVKGDQYIADMSRTKGHTAPLTSGCWHPRVRDEFLTSSEDSTCRLWDVKKPFSQKNVIKCRAQNGLKTTPTTCTFSRDGNLVVCACIDGSIQMWDYRKMFVNTSQLLRNAHQQGSEISSISFSYQGNLFVSRSCDETLKLWDLRAFKKPVNVVKGLFSRYSTTDCTFSPDDSLVMTGKSLDRGENEGKLFFFDGKTLDPVKDVIVADSHTIRMLWHPRLQQIFVGCGDGTVKIYYDDKKSMRGAKLCAKKTRTKTKQMEVVSAQQIITPHALPMFRQDKPKSNRKKLEKERLDPIKSQRPDLPIKSGQGGRVAASGSTLSSYVIRNLGLSKKIEDDQDPREAILRYAKAAAEDPYWITPAYSKTQPETIFQKNEQDDDDESNDEPANKKQKL